MKHGNLSLSFVSDGANNVGGTQCTNTYDANGNLTKAGENRHYEWNVNDKLAVFKNQAGSSTPTVYTNYFYYAWGERVKKHTRKGNKVTVTVYMDGGMFEVSYVKPTGTDIDNNRFYNTLHILAETSRIATVLIGNDADDPTPQVKYCLEDHLMDSLVVLNSQGNLVNREEFYPFGETSFGGFAKKRYRYNGKEKDEESGLYEYGQRYYAPWVCRFVSVDPVAEKFADLSSYNYAGNKPITKRDQEGLQEEGRKVSPKGKGEGEKESKGKKEEVKKGQAINLAPLPDHVQREIDDAIASAQESGNDLEIIVHQTEESFSVTINEAPQAETAEPQMLELPKDPEFLIRDQKKELETNEKTHYPDSSERALETVPEKDPVLPARNRSSELEPVDPPSQIDQWGVVREGANFWVEKTRKLLDWAGDVSSNTAKALKIAGRSLGIAGIVLSISTFYKDLQTKPTWVALTKGIVGVGLGVAGLLTLATPVGWAILAGGVVYGMLEATGTVDKGLLWLDRNVMNPQPKYIPR